MLFSLVLLSPFFCSTHFDLTSFYFKAEQPLCFFSYRTEVRKGHRIMKLKLTKAELKEKLRPWVRALTNPHLLLSLGIAWFLTNGWAYCAIGLGAFLEIGWLFKAGSVWAAMLWVPGTPEKLVTFPIAIFILRRLFPDDTRTLAMIDGKWKSAKEKTKLRYRKFREKLRSKRKKELPAHKDED